MQGLGTFYIKETTAHALFSFGGDGMGMVIATALMATFFFGKRTQLYKGWLRWGFLAIGAAAFSDMSATWCKALSDTRLGARSPRGSDPKDELLTSNMRIGGKK